MGWGGFEVVRSLGVGATSEVFEVINTSSKQHSALKVFSQLVLSDADLVERLQDEVKILNQLRHPNIVGLLSHHRSQNGAFALELELIEGSDLRQWLKGYDLPLIEPKLWLLAQVARGLGAAHEMGVIHRDLKPENILVSQTGEVKITDFGLARQISRLTITRLGLLVGSLGYMAPEMIAGQKATTASDIFSFGVIAYEVLCGKSPFEGETPQALIRQITDIEVRPPRQINPRIPETVSNLIEQCLAKEPKERPDGIWLLEAHLMTAVSSSGLLRYGMALVGEESRQNELPGALKTKLQNLKAQIALAKTAKFGQAKEMTAEARNRNNRKAMTALTEIIDLFPDQEGINDLVQDIGEREFRRPHLLTWVFNRSGLFVVLFACGIGVFTWLWIGRTSPPSNSLAPATLSQTEPARVKKITQKSPAIKAQAALGSLQFDVDEDVSIFVDDKLVPQTQWNNLPIQVGEHQIRMVKEGFVPIDQIIQVTAHKPSVVRARGQQ